MSSFSQVTKSPNRHREQVWQWPPCHPPPTRSPSFHLVSEGGTATTSPTISWPGTRGYCMGYTPCGTCSSLSDEPRFRQQSASTTRPFNQPATYTARNDLHDHFACFRVSPGDGNSGERAPSLEEGVCGVGVGVVLRATLRPFDTSGHCWIGMGLEAFGR